MNVQILKKDIRKIVPSYILNYFIYMYASILCNKKKLIIKKYKFFIDICDNSKKRCIRISNKHLNYVFDIINSFQYYYKAVEPLCIDGINIVDYSTPRYHNVKGYNLHPIIFPSFAEPLSTTRQYLKSAHLKAGSIVLDLGAYSGLTSILFDQLVGDRGRVIAVDADKINVEYIKKNLFLYEKITKRKIDLLIGAVWKDNNGLFFSNEGNMGSSAVSIVGKRGDNKVSKIKSFTLFKITELFHLKKVDFIKCDIEGAEAYIFNNKNFFKKFKPRIIIELHVVNSKSTYKNCVDELSKFGYKFKNIKQNGVQLPLLECQPS